MASNFASRLGDHSHTVSVDYDGAPLAVDIGFIVYNELNYPDLTALFALLEVQTTQSNMSFAAGDYFASGKFAPRLLADYLAPIRAAFKYHG